MPATLSASGPEQMAMTLGQVADHFGVERWRVRRIFERGILPEGPRVGASRVFLPGDLPRIGEALARANYLPAGPMKVPA